MTNKKVLRLLKTLMTIGFSLILLGAYFSFSDYTKDMGVKGIILSAGCIAVGMALSLPTKMYLTFVFMNRENDKHSAEPTANTEHKK